MRDDEVVMEAFRRCVDQAGERVALVAPGRSLGYGELDRRSDAVAALLARQGVGEGALVPLLADRSPELVIGILGILKAGAAYVPVPLSHPRQRIDEIVAQCGARLALATSAAAPAPRACAGLNIAGLPAAAQPWRRSAAAPRRPAYVIFTSGTSGAPKGVVIEHGSLGNLIAWHNREFAVTADSRLTSMAGIGFDVAQWEIWSALCAGAPLYLLDEALRRDAGALPAFYARHAITHAFVPTAMAAEVVAADAPPDLALRYLFTAGERLAPVDTDGVGYQLVDYYGPTEATIFATMQRVPSASLGRPASIGRPVAGAQAYILDQALRELPPGEPGELCIAGPGLARGYLGQPALTAEKFVLRDGRRLYRSGDLARSLPDGSLQFLGRLDEQVKIRGNRVELGEIEARLARLPQLAKAAVALAVPEDPARREIVAFLQPREARADEATLVAAVRAELKRVLPEYMLPAGYLVVAALPRTANGKIDKPALLRRYQAKAAALPALPAERDGWQAQVARAFGEQLGHGGFGPHDSFFEIGGHSLLAAALAADLSTKLATKVYIRDLYDHPSVAALAAALERRAGRAASAVDGEPVRALRQDVSLPGGVRYAYPSRMDGIVAPRQLMLTGATGFVGIHLLVELLASTDATIHCPVRARDQAHALARLAEAAAAYDLELTPRQVARIRLYAADLAEPRFGLAAADYDYLADTVEMIYHSASAVNFIQPYSYMRRDNVQGLQEILRLAGTGRTKPLALLSTISVYSWGHLYTGKRVMREDDDIDQNLAAVSTDIGYVRSKWVMEKIADLAASRGLPLMTFRLGYATFHSRTGACAGYQWWSRLVRTCIAHGTVPDLRELREGLTTVDYMTRAIAHISRHPSALGLKFNLIHAADNNLTLRDFFRLLERHFGFAFRPLPYAQWVGQWEGDTQAPLYPLLSLFKDVMHDGKSTVELYQDTYLWDCRHVADFLRGSGIEEPRFEAAELRRYLQRSIGVVAA